MKKKLVLLSVFLSFSLLCSGQDDVEEPAAPSAASGTEIVEAASASLELILDNPDVYDSTETASSSEAVPDAVPEAVSEVSATADETAGEIDYFESDPFAGTSYADIENELLSIRTRALKTREYTRNMLARIDALTRSRYDRRQGEYLSRAAYCNLFVIESALHIFTKLFETANVIACNTIGNSLERVGTELVREPLAREIRLSRLDDVLDIQCEAAELFRRTAAESEKILKAVEQITERTSSSGSYFSLMRKTNRERVKLVRSLYDNVQVMLKRFDECVKQRRVNLAYLDRAADLADVDYIPVVSRVLSSYKLFGEDIKACRARSAAVSARYYVITEALASESAGLNGIPSRERAKISAYKAFPKFDVSDEKEPLIDPLPAIEEMFQLLDKMSEASRAITEDIHKDMTEQEAALAKETTEFLLEHFKKHLVAANWPDNVIPIPETASDSEELELDPDEYDESDEYEDF